LLADARADLQRTVTCLPRFARRGLQHSLWERRKNIGAYPLQLSTAIGTLALLLAAVLVAGHALGDDAIPPASAPTTMQKKVDEREAQRRAAAADQKKKQEEFAKRCTKPVKTPYELEECRTVYRQM
jgi:hypothetical protein